MPALFSGGWTDELALLRVRPSADGDEQLKMPVLSLEEVELAYAAMCITGIVPRVSIVPFLGIRPRVGRRPASALAGTTARSRYTYTSPSGPISAKAYKTCVIWFTGSSEG